MNHMKSCAQNERNRGVQNLSKSKHTKSQEFGTKSKTNEKGEEKDLPKDEISTKKSFYFTT